MMGVGGNDVTSPVHIRTQATNAITETTFRARPLL